MKIKEIKAKSIVVKTQLPEGEFVINPYVGCMHGCIFCYARFMKRFTGHKEDWGKFLDVKVNAPDLIKGKKYKGRGITVGSVTDPYPPVELKYKITRKILKKLIPLQPYFDLLTKSDLVVRDIDLFKQIKEGIVAISMSNLDTTLSRKLEPGAPSPERRIIALKKLHKAGVKNALFVSPILPGITDWKAIIKKTKSFVDEYWFENLHLYPSIRKNIYDFLNKNYPELVNQYKGIYSGKSNYWYDVEKDIANYCKKNKLKHKIYFHHKIKAKSDT